MVIKRKIKGKREEKKKKLKENNGKIVIKPLRFTKLKHKYLKHVSICFYVSGAQVSVF